MLPQEVREVAHKIGQFYLAEFDNWSPKAREHLLNLQIKSIEIVDDVVVIITGRPGILIGRRGEDIDKLVRFIGKKIKVVETMDNVYDYLLDFDSSLLEGGEEHYEFFPEEHK